MSLNDLNQGQKILQVDNMRIYNSVKTLFKPYELPANAQNEYDINETSYSGELTITGFGAMVSQSTASFSISNGAFSNAEQNIILNAGGTNNGARLTFDVLGPMQDPLFIGVRNLSGQTRSEPDLTIRWLVI